MTVLGSQLTDLARARGEAAAAALAAGGRPSPCPWDPDAGSITQARMAHVFLDAFNAAAPAVAELPE